MPHHAEHGERPYHCLDYQKTFHAPFRRCSRESTLRKAQNIVSGKSFIQSSVFSSPPADDTEEKPQFLWRMWEKLQVKLTPGWAPEEPTIGETDPRVQHVWGSFQPQHNFWLHRRESLQILDVWHQLTCTLQNLSGGGNSPVSGIEEVWSFTWDTRKLTAPEWFNKEKPCMIRLLWS